MNNFRAIFPTAKELPPGWQKATWWNAVRKNRRSLLARVYLNGAGTDHELRFSVWLPDWNEIPKSRWPRCETCGGTGRVRRPVREPGFLDWLRPSEIEFDPADVEGLRECPASHCKQGRTEPIYGAANDRMRLPDFPQDLARKTDPRGLAQPTKDDVLRVVAWCDALIEKLDLEVELP